jgi:hypothetical protein
MDDKQALGSVGALELADKVDGGSPISSAGGNMTRDEGEMAFYGKKAQLKVHLFGGTNAAMPGD